MIRRSCISTLAAIVLAVALSAANVRAETHEIHGKAQVLSGDTLVVHSQRIRLFGIDAPELGQTCRWPNKTIDCGRISTTGLLDLIAPVAVTCGRKSMRPDGTWIGTCKAEGFDVGANMVHTGWAVASPDDPAGYGKIEAKAKAGRRGLWRGTFEMPWVWRKNR